MKFFKILLSMLFIINLIQANDNASQWRGKNRQGHFNETGLLKQWPENGPEMILEVSGIGDGWSSPVATNDQIFVTGKFDSLDYLMAISYDGKFQWKQPMGKAWPKTFPDARTTPVIDGNKVYTQSGEGEVSCFNATSGERLWFVEVDTLTQSRRDRWGVSETPLLYKNLIITSPVGEDAALVALDKNSGEFVWKTDTIPGNRTYLSAVLYKHKNVEQILSMTSEKLFAVNPINGEIEWIFHYDEHCKGFEDFEWWGSIITNSPIIKNNEIFITKGYDFPSVMLKVAEDGKSVTAKWTNWDLDNHHHGVVEYNGYIYGSNWIDNRRGDWVCLNWDTGELSYQHTWNVKGPIIEADNMFYILDEKRGNVGLLKPNPEKFDLVSEFKFDGGKGMFWCHPSIFDKKLFIRHGEVLNVFDIKK